MSHINMAFRGLRLLHNSQGCRTFLSAAYRCEDKWSSRLKSPLIAGISAGDYAFELDRKYKREGKVSAIDVDLFVNRLESNYVRNMTLDIEELIQRLRRSPETIDTLPSTPHATLRILLETRRTKLLLKFLDNPLEYGIFPDHYVSNLLMDTFIEEKNYTAAARVASKLMLQEDYGPPLTQALAMASCYFYVTSSENLPWENYTIELQEPEEEVKIKVRYLRNPYFDDHFDLKEPNHIVGKTLVRGATLIGGDIGVNCEILGWALYNKWSDLANSIRNVGDTQRIAASVISSVKEIVNSSEKEEIKDEILGLIAQLESNGSRVVEIDLNSLIQDLVQKEAAKSEAEDIKAQEEVYSLWEDKREEEVQNQVAEYKRKQLLAEIEEKKKYLAAKEEVMTFFENQDRLEMLLTKKPKPMEYDRIHFFPQKKRKPRKIDEDYIPPEI